MHYSFGGKTKFVIDFSNHIIFSMIQFKHFLKEIFEESEFNSSCRGNFCHISPTTSLGYNTIYNAHEMFR